MASQGLYRTKILGTGSYIPERVLSNKDLEKMVETNDEWISDRTGIRNRRIAADNECTSDLAVRASLNAMEMAGVKAEDIDMIIFGTVTPDTVMPNTACILQKKLGCRPVMAFDISAACTGFVYGLAIADQFIRAGVYKHVLVVGAEVLSRIVNYEDRETCILFGDGAGVAVVGRAPEGDTSGVMSVHLGADGNLGDLFILPGGGSAMPFSQEVLDNKHHFVKMKGREIFKNAVRTMAQRCEEALTANNLTKDDVRWVIPHQANRRIIEAVGSHFGIPDEKIIYNLEHTGNTSAATVPMALDVAVRDGRIRRGDLVLMTAFGAGLTNGSVMVRF